MIVLSCLEAQNLPKAGNHAFMTEIIFVIRLIILVIIKIIFGYHGNLSQRPAVASPQPNAAAASLSNNSMGQQMTPDTAKVM